MESWELDLLKKENEEIEAARVIDETVETEIDELVSRVQSHIEHEYGFLPYEKDILQALCERVSKMI